MSRGDGRAVTHIATRLLESVRRKPLRIGDQDLRLTISVAAGILPPEVTDLDGILRWSREALKVSKEGGQNRINFH